MKLEDLVELPEPMGEPIGQFLEENAVGVIQNNGRTYYSHEEVCGLIRLYHKKWLKSETVQPCCGANALN